MKLTVIIVFVFFFSFCLAITLEHGKHRSLNRSGSYVIDLPEEISQSNGHDLAVRMSNDTLYVYFDNSGK